MQAVPFVCNSTVNIKMADMAILFESRRYSKFPVLLFAIVLPNSFVAFTTHFTTHCNNVCWQPAILTRKPTSENEWRHDTSVRNISHMTSGCLAWQLFRRPAKRNELRVSELQIWNVASRWQQSISGTVLTVVLEVLEVLEVLQDRKCWMCWRDTPLCVNI